MPIRINPETESDLYNFIQEKGGPKKGLKFLYNYYQTNKNLSESIYKLIDEFDSGTVIKPKPQPKKLSEIATIKPEPIQVDDEDVMIMSNLIK